MTLTMSSEFPDLMAEAERIAGFGVWRWDIARGEVRWSEGLHALYGIQPGEFGGTVDDFLSRLHPDDRPRVWELVSHSLQTHEPFAFEERIVWPDGSERLLLSQGRVEMAEDGRPAALIGVCHDITARRQAERALGMSERRLRAIVDNSPSVIAVKNLDGRYLMANAEAGRLLGIGADELIGQLCTDLFPAEVAQQLRANDHIAAAEGRPAYDETILVRDHEPRAYDTITFPLPDDDGRPVEICTIGTDVTERRERESERRIRQEWEEKVCAAIAEERMLVYAQPVVDAASGEVAACELLLRMRAPDSDDVLLPGTFLPVVERLGLIQRVDLWVVERAMALAKERRCAVNLSAVTLCDPAARDEIARLMGSDPAAAANLTFEITETAAAGHIDAAASFAEGITALGCGLALDDFGTGFGSFTYLRRLPLRYLKVDLSFVIGMADSEDDRRVVQSIIGIAGQFGLRTIAEGVEDVRTLELLRAMGADFVQGFHLGRPAPVRTAAAR